MALSLTQKWLQKEVSPYAQKDRVFADIDASLAAYATLRPKSDIYTYDDGRVARLLCIHGLLPITYRGSTYNIPISCWIQLDYPRAPPIAYVVPTSDMLVKPGPNVDVSGKCRMDYVVNWERKSEGCNIKTLLEVMQATFSREPPVYAKPKGLTTPARPSSSTPASPAPIQTSAMLPRPASGASSVQATSHLPDGRPLPPPKPSQASTPVNSSSPSPVHDPRGYGSPAVPFSSPSINALATRPPPPIPNIHGSPPSYVGSPSPQSHQRGGSVETVYPSNPPAQPQWQHLGPPNEPSSHRWSMPPQHSHIQSPQPVQYTGQSHQPPPQPQPYMQSPVAHQTSPPPPPLLAPSSQTRAPIHDFLSEANDETPASTSHNPHQPMPPRPPNPELLALHSQIHAKLTAELSNLNTVLTTDADRLRSTQADLLAGEPAIRDEMARLEAVRNVCVGVKERTKAWVEEAELWLVRAKSRGDVSVDELVCSTTIVYNQLIDLVAEDNAIEDTMYHLHRALNAGRIELDRYIKVTRELAGEQFMKRALIAKIIEELPIGVWT